ncbi:WD40 repeat [Fusarium oxysporum f. sp. vasinfectum]|nr:WD40 repeat [Fusarium oxysporum f. sp. vasinfectum]
MALQTQKDYDALYKRLTTVPPPGKPYGIPVPGTERPNRTAAYRHWAVGDGPLVTALEPGINSTHDVLERSARKWPNSRCLGTRHWNQATQQWEDKYDWISYGDFDARRKNFGAGLVEIHKAINYSPEKYGVGLWSQNRAEWQIADFGIASQSLYSVSLYETLGPDTTEYIINHAEVACVVCSLPHIPVLLKMSPRLPGLKLIVSLDPLEQGELASHTKASVLNEIASHHGIQIYSMTQVEEIGAKSGRAPRAPSRNDICTINYTSGTTGNPKGVLITHGNAVSAIAGGRTNGNVSSKDVHLSYLPLAHIYGRLIDQIAVAEGAAIGFFRGDILGLVDDMKILKPTGFISVPRLFNRFNSAIRTATIEADGVRGALSRRVIDTKKANMRLPPGKASNTHFLYDRIWTPKVKAAVGMDRVHSMVSGSAQLDPDVQEFLRAAFANHFAQGFGMTETYAVGSIQARGDFTTGNIGGPMCCVELCLESVPEFDYTVNDKPNPRGELLLRGPVIFREYYKNAEETEKTLDADGWFHSGDICEVDKMGRFKIIDRKKNRIENVYMGSTNLINAAYVHGDGTQSSLVAIFGIDVENFAPFASKILQETIAPNQVADLRLAANDPKVKAKFLKVLDGIGKKHKFNSFEKVRNAHLEIDPFTIDNGLFTPTLKLKRPQAAKAYREHIDRMYEELAAQEPVGKNKLSFAYPLSSSETPEPQLLPPPRSTPKSQPQGQTAPTIVNTEATRKSEDRDSPIFYDALTSQPSHQPELPQNVERKPYRPRERREPKPSNRYYQISERPYLSAAHRKAIEEGTKKPVAVNNELIAQPIVYHVDFSPEEIAEIIGQISQNENKHIPATRESMMEQIRLRNRPLIPIPGRTIRDMSAFASDLWAGKVAETPRVLSFTAEHVTEETKKQQGQMRRTSRLSSLLMAREMEGNQGFQRTREYLNFQAEFKRLCEDDLQVVTEFTNCAGDITTGAWVSRESFLCGTTTHSDTHNQQYNRPGNLLLCSTGKGTLRSFPDHRIPRPRVEKGGNSTEAMRQSQDPWLYSSVVSCDYSAEDDLAYTSSFDKTVKVWKVDPKGEHMEAIATWQHTGNVNFVAAAEDGSGRVATAADSPTDAVRIYTITKGNESNSTYQTFSCSRTDADGSEKWAYFPATMQWGRAKGCQHLLLVGYSPRSLTGDDLDIPEDKRSSGEIILWDAEQGVRIPVMTASTANVFEVAWHPTLPLFLVGVTPTGMNNVPRNVRTQVHVFHRDKDRLNGIGFCQHQALDCYASDINELTIVPNSPGHAYVTAACTDGKVYIWDTAQGDKPIHTLRHGKPIEEYYGDREKEDTGVKFTAWNTSLDRLYTGSSDGVVKVWNVRKLKNPFVRDILTAPGPIAWGGFSPDNSKLAIGDATGRCFILSTDERDIPESHMMTLPGTTRRRRRPIPLIPHPEPAPPTPARDDDEMLTDDELSDANIADYSRRTYLDSQCLKLTSNPVIGVVQGPRYQSTNLYRREAHYDEDPSAPLLAHFERRQKDSEAASLGRRRRSVRRLRTPSPPDERLQRIHAQNASKDLDVNHLEDSEVKELVKSATLLSIEEDWGFIYEETMSSDEDA